MFLKACSNITTYDLRFISGSDDENAAPGNVALGDIILVTGGQGFSPRCQGIGTRYRFIGPEEGETLRATVDPHRMFRGLSTQ
jgi:hypothetical protein